MTFTDGFPDFIRKSYTYSYSLGAYSAVHINKTNLNWTSDPSGYAVLTCAAFDSGNAVVHVSEMNLTDANYTFRIFNRSGSTVTGTVTLRVIFMRSNFLHN